MGGSVGIPLTEKARMPDALKTAQMARVNHAKRLINAMVDNLDVTRQSALFTRASNVNIAVQLLLEDDISRQALLGFMRQNRAEENLFFFEEVDDLEECSEVTFIAQANKIYRDYLVPGCAFEVVVIPPPLKQNILDIYSKNSFTKAILLPYLQQASTYALEVMLDLFSQCKATQRLKTDAYQDSFILVSDSNPLLLKALSSELIRHGFCVDLAKSREEAFNKMNNKAYKGVLMDVNFAETLSAIELVKQWRCVESDRIASNPRYQRVCIVGTAAVQVSGMEGECIYGGMDAFLMKPVDVNKFIAILNKAELKEVIDLRKSEKAAKATGGASLSSKSSKQPASVKLKDAAVKGNEVFREWLKEADGKYKSTSIGIIIQ